MAKVKSKETKAEEQRSYYFRNKVSIQKRRNKTNPQLSNITEVEKAQRTQERNKEAFDKSYFGRFNQWYLR